MVVIKYLGRGRTVVHGDRDEVGSFSGGDAIQKCPDSVWTACEAINGRLKKPWFELISRESPPLVTKPVLPDRKTPEAEPENRNRIMKRPPVSNKRAANLKPKDPQPDVFEIRK